MRWLCRWLLDSLAGISLLAALLVLVVWMSRILPQDFWLQYYFTPYDKPTNRIQVGLGLDKFDVIHTHWFDHAIIGPYITDQQACAAFMSQFPPPKRYINVWRVRIVSLPLFRTDKHYRLTMGRWAHMFVIPYSLLAPALLLTPVLRFGPRFVRWMTNPNSGQPGYCAACGYDLRATPRRCPECGTIPSEIAPAPPNLPLAPANI